jgi:hypothetical protein
MDPSVKQVSKNIFKRKMDELAGLTREMIFVNTPYTADEYRAVKYVNMINYIGRTEKKPEGFNMFKPGMDNLTYWLYI